MVVAVAAGVLHLLSSSSSRIVCLSTSSRPPLSGAVAKVVLKKGKTQLFKDGSPMVYSGAVDRIIGKPPPKTGDVVIVADGTENPIGWGLYNSVSMFCVRLMQLQHESTRDPSCALNVEKLLQTRITQAVQLRNHLGLPSENNHTNAYRLVNSEGDRLSGLIVDVFGDIAVVASSAAWIEKYRNHVEACLRSSVHGVNHINWRPSLDLLKEDGFDISSLKLTQSSSSSPPLPERSMVVENGITYAISLEGQKTGFYTDQRENRHFISTISSGKRVLDLCCYSGGFALNAAKGGATSVLGIDSSLPALELARENVILNDMDPGKVVFFKQDSTEFMKGALSREETWDIVILDPPKLAPRKKVLHNAAGMYRNLNSLAMRLTSSGGLLMTCSCSGAMTQSGKFLSILQSAAAMAGKKITVVREAGAASDHPLDPSYPQGHYLSNFLLRVL
ncbi:S-adenosyl-L-methionine-dependent methyltransferases superfamily protein [Raphanus sativus]|nr:S-adenosyl-L-methionine-dependent methyltransferases superfamily protein [Raphanus sativus]